MVDTLPYLLQYPYGCTEQTLNRFLPAVLTQRTLQKMGVNLADVKKQRTNLDAQQTYRGKYPTHWGEQPQIQTRDIRELPAGFGQGSSTLATVDSATHRRRREADEGSIEGLQSRLR